MEKAKEKEERAITIALKRLIQIEERAQKAYVREEQKKPRKKLKRL